jgi:hypothetical protein
MFATNEYCIQFEKHVLIKLIEMLFLISLLYLFDFILL